MKVILFLIILEYITPMSPSNISKLTTITPKSIKRMSSKFIRGNLINSIEKNINSSENEINKFPEIVTRHSSKNILKTGITNPKIKNLRINSPMNRNVDTNSKMMTRGGGGGGLITNSNNSTQYNSYSSPKNNNEQHDIINVSTLINNQNIPISISNLSAYFPYYESTKCSSKSIGLIKAYAANTYQGIIRNYNEDRVSVILNIAKPHNYQGNWPRSSFFGIYDGHGGSNCADFLRDHLHSYVIRDQNFPSNPAEALRRGFERAESDFIYTHAMNSNMDLMDKSGSCAVVALIVDEMCYVANVGDSRCVLSMNGGKNVNVLTNDHKPNEDGENTRIIDKGGKVYQTQTPSRMFNIPGQSDNTNQVILGPHRVFPGRLSVSRTFGDVEAKIPKFGGIPGVVIATPEIKSFMVDDKSDYILLGCDGIFDQISNRECTDSVWMTMKEETRTKDFHSQCALGVDMVMKTSLVRRTLDNVTVLLIAFQNFEHIFYETNKEKNENFSPKSSFYLYNVIDNKENLIESLDTETVDRENTYRNVLTNKNNQDKIMSPKNNLKLYTNNINNSVNSKSNLFNMSKAKLNKVVNMEISKKIIMSPKNKKTMKLDTEFSSIPELNQITDPNKFHSVKAKHTSINLIDDKQKYSMKRLQG